MIGEERTTFLHLSLEKRIAELESQVKALTKIVEDHQKSVNLLSLYLANINKALKLTSREES